MSLKDEVHWFPFIAICLLALGVAVRGVLIVEPQYGSVISYLPTVPGVVNKNITLSNVSKTLCNKSWSTSSIRPPTSYTNGLKREFMVKYGLSGGVENYELDHLISLQLGGDPKDPQNLWMEPYCTTKLCTANSPDASKDLKGAKAKDKAENKLHRELCVGGKSLTQVQDEIRHWKPGVQWDYGTDTDDE